MGLDTAHLAAALSKSQELERSPNAVQRVNDIAQDELAAEAMTALARKKANATDHLQREKIRQDRERRRREMERRKAHPDTPDSPDADDGPVLDVVA
jgi:hypothetical protein